MGGGGGCARPVGQRGSGLRVLPGPTRGPFSDLRPLRDSCSQEQAPRSSVQRGEVREPVRVLGLRPTGTDLTRAEELCGPPAPRPGGRAGGRAGVGGRRWGRRGPRNTDSGTCRDSH